MGQVLRPCISLRSCQPRMTWEVTPAVKRGTAGPRIWGEGNDHTRALGPERAAGPPAGTVCSRPAGGLSQVPGSQVLPGRGRDLCVSVALCSGWCPVQDHTLKTAAGGFGESRVLMERVVVLRWTSKVKSSSSRVPGLGPCTRGTRSSGEKRSFGVLPKFASAPGCLARP